MLPKAAFCLLLFPPGDPLPLNLIAAAPLSSPRDMFVSNMRFSSICSGVSTTLGIAPTLPIFSHVCSFCRRWTLWNHLRKALVVSTCDPSAR